MTSTPTKCHLLEKDLVILAKIVRQQPPSDSITLSHFIFGHRTHYYLKSYKTSSCLHVFLPLKCGFPKYRVACSYYHLQKNNGWNIYSMNKWGVTWDALCLNTTMNRTDKVPELMEFTF